MSLSFVTNLARNSMSHRLFIESLEPRQMLTVLTVDTALDSIDPQDGVTSLREAIALANETPGKDQITFELGQVDPVTIRLELGELELTDALTITGPGQDRLVIDAHHRSRFFSITAAQGDFVFEGLTLVNGRGFHRYTTTRGGAIRSDTLGQLTLRDSVISRSMVKTYDFGAGIVASGDVVIQASSIEGNAGTKHSSVVSSGGNVSLSSSTIIGNSGGIRAAGDVTIAASTISKNGSKVLGGSGARWPGVVDVDGNVTVVNSTISDNTLSAIRARGKVAVTASTISGNKGSCELVLGCFFIPGGISAADVMIRLSTVSGNTEGGISAENIEIESSTIVGNDAGFSTEEWNGTAGVKFSKNLRLHNSIVAGHADADVLFSPLDPGLEFVSNFICSVRNECLDPLSQLDGMDWSVSHSLVGSKRGTLFIEAPLSHPDSNGNLIGGPENGVIDPGLGQLLDNGGSTRTHALLPASPAINMGAVDEIMGADQRGQPYSRVQEGRVDMGAFERGIDGDTDGDGDVDFTDFLALSSHFGTGSSWKEGNFDGSEDGTQFADFLALSFNFGMVSN